MKPTLAATSPQRLVVYLGDVLLAHAVKDTANGSWLVTFIGNKRDTWERAATITEAQRTLKRQWPDLEGCDANV